MKIACIGVGLIGSGWATHFLRAGHDVIAFDPDQNRREELFARVKAGLAVTGRLGTEPAADISKLRFTTILGEALDGAEFVQESAGERIGLKREILGTLDAKLPEEVLIATSSSGFLLQDLITNCHIRPDRVIVAHPFHPPYLIPLVEIVASDPDGDVARAACDLFRSFGSEPVVLRAEIRGYVGNRLQSAVFREMLYLIEQGVVSAGDIDTVMRSGPGLRWPITGPALTNYLGAGSEDALESFIRLLADEIRAGYTAPAGFVVHNALEARYASELRELYGGSMAIAQQRRDRLLVDLRQILETDVQKTSQKEGADK
jgi:carnitine 3-dehydrogenase